MTSFTEWEMLFHLGCLISISCKTNILQKKQRNTSNIFEQNLNLSKCNWITTFEYKFKTHQKFIRNEFFNSLKKFINKQNSLKMN